jgi:hypothetical protein
MKNHLLQPGRDLLLAENLPFSHARKPLMVVELPSCCSHPLRSGHEQHVIRCQPASKLELSAQSLGVAMFYKLNVFRQIRTGKSMLRRGHFFSADQYCTR